LASHRGETCTPRSTTGASACSYYLRERARRFTCRRRVEQGTVLSMALDDERCCFCRRAVRVQEWTARPGWLEVECPVCGLYRVERRFWVTAHFKKARQPVLYRRLAWWLAESRDRAQPPEIPFEGWEGVAGSRSGA
jgi:hypothetical protein